jgi:hypothetical protein
MGAPYTKRFGTGVAGLTGAVVLPMPTHEAGDILLLHAEAGGGADIDLLQLSDAQGFVQIGSTVFTPGVGGISGTQSAMFWKRATSAAEPAPSVIAANDHISAMIHVIGGAKATGAPYSVTSTDLTDPVNTAHSWAGLTTPVDNCLVVVGASFHSQLTAPTVANADLVDVRVLIHFSTTNANDGGYSVISGIRQHAGAVGDTTVASTSQLCAVRTIAIEPEEEPVDATPPQITNITPANGEDIRRETIIELDVTDETGLAIVGINVVWEDEEGEHCEVAHDGTNFRGAYVNEASVRTVIAGGYHFKLRRSDGWPVDADGDTRELSFEYPILDTSSNLAVAA